MKPVEFLFPRRATLLTTFLLLASFSAMEGYAATTLVSPALPQATAGQAYSALLSAQGGTSPYTYSVSLASAPDGLSITSNGNISGTPSKAGQYTLAVKVLDAASVVTNLEATLRVNSTSGLSFASIAPAGTASSFYDFTFAAQGGTASYSWDVILGSGSLPNGLTLTAAGRLSGTPNVPGVYPITIRVTDVVGNSFQSALSIRINANSFSISTVSLAGAFLNVPYSQTITATGGTGPYSFGLISGGLPPGLTNSSSGLISGIPTSSGTFNFFIRATDSMGATAQASYSIIVANTGPKILITSLPTGIVYQAFSGSLTAQGGTAPYMFSLVVGPLPQGLTLSANGGITGTPTATGIFPITVRTVDAGGLIAQADLIININSSAFAITSAVLADGFVNQAFSFALTSGGGSGTVTYNLLSGNLPTGITLATNGALTGTPTVAGTYAFAVRAVDSASASAQIPLTIRILPSGLSIQQTALPIGAVGQPFTTTLTPSNGLAPYTFSQVSGTLPAGITLSANGNLSGIPTVSGVYQFTVRVVDANQNSSLSTLNLYIGSLGLNITTISLPAARVGQTYSSNLFSSGGALPYNYAVVAGNLPVGLTLSQNGMISGTATAAGSSTFTIKVTDNASAVSQATYTLNVNSSTSFTITPGSLPSGQLARAYSATLSASGGTSPYTYAITIGAPPVGLTLSSSGIITGIPTVAGAYAFVVQISDSTNASVFYSQSITISASDLSITTTLVRFAQQGADYLEYITGSGGNAPYNFSLVGGSLPPGLTLNTNGTVSGIATGTGVYPVSVRIIDQSGNTATANLTFTVLGSGVLQITTNALPTARLGQLYSSLITASGGQQPYLFSLSGGGLPDGLQLAANGQISGTPTTNGSSSFAIRLQDSVGAATLTTLTLNVISSTLNIPQDLLVAGRVGEAYSTLLGASGGSGIAYSFQLVGGNLPSGLTLSSTGLLAGTPTASGSFPVVIRVIDSAGSFYQKAYTLSINSNGLAFTSTSLPIAYLGQFFRFSLQAAGGMPPYTFSVVNGVPLPSGLTLNGNGEITGLPDTASNSAVTFRVVDAAGSANTVTLPFNVTQSTLQFNFSVVPTAIVGQLYSFTPTALGGTGPYTFTLVSAPPAGLSISPTGIVSGVPSQEGTYNLTIRVQDSLGAAIQANYGLTVLGAGFRITSPTLNPMRINQAFSQTLTTAGGIGAVTYMVQSGSLPIGLTLSSAGALSGTPTVAGTYTFTVRATDSTNATAVTIFNVEVLAPVIIFDVPNAGSGTIGQPYTLQLNVKGGTAPYTYSLSGGVLVPGLSLSTTGLISGSPTSTGTFAFTVKATDTVGNANTQDLILGVSAVGAPKLNAVVSAANYAANGVVPGEILVIFGNNLGVASLLPFTVTNNSVPTTLAGTRVLFDGVPASLVYVSQNQVAVIAPVGIASKASVFVTVEYLGSVSAVFPVQVKSAKPALFTVDSSGKGAGAILNQDVSVNTSANPAKRETVVSLYLTGAGLTAPLAVDGLIINTVANLSNSVAVTINGQPAVVQYAGNAPSLIPGVAQINVKLPVGTKSGPNTIVVTIGTAQTTSEVVVFVE